MNRKMKQGTGIVAAVIALALAAGMGYRLGQRGSAEPAAPAAAAAPTARKLLYYRNPMGLPDTSPTPKKDPMGMDYVAVYAGEDGDSEPSAGNVIKISSEKVQKLGVRTEAAQLRAVDRRVRAAGRVEVDERRVFTVAPKFEGWVERLHVSVTGQPVVKGQPLFEVYSPELVSAQREYAIAAQGVAALKDAAPDARAAMQQLADAALARLGNWDISAAQVKALAKSGETKRTLTFLSPATGIVTEKKAVQGMRFSPGEALYQVADLSAVWVVADVFENDIGLIKAGAKAQVRFDAYPDKVFEGTISYVYPTLNAETRTVPVRIELANPGGLLKPAMYAQVELPVAAKGAVVTVPVSAVIDGGARRIVLVQVGAGRYEPREVTLGARGDDFVAVTAGIKAGEQVVVAANFLIDAESNLKAAVSGFGATSGGEAQAAAAKTVGHQGVGKLAAVDVQAGSVSITHGPIAELKWPGMTMDFQLANPGLLGKLKRGDAVAFSFVERKPGEWVIVKLEPAPAAAQAEPAGH
ncbi:MAG: efflux RND transporter periplasmic adaptor subunit [Rhodocyclaceae bacterium]|nr:efflux RND transporter periplasmic adaptor subunit [Rhodocyclaceae bacterium]